MSSQPTNAEGQTAADCANLLRSIKPLAQEYEINLQKQKDFDIGFNLFNLISDHYYRETFHSDILNALLDPNGKHGEKQKYLDLFLEFLCSQHKANINLSYYSTAQVVKEEGRIDILIKGCKNAIIVENKINGAGDMKKQLPRYLKKVLNNGYACDAIIYLRLNGDAGPNMSQWEQDEQYDVNKRLKVICAYDGTGKERDLLSGWILKCETKSEENSDARHILRQYGKLIEKLGVNILNKPIMKMLYETIIKDGNFETALTLQKMLNDLISYRLERIADEFKSDAAPFANPSLFSDGVLFYQSFGQANFEMAVWAQPKSYLFEFKDKNDPEGVKGLVAAILEKLGCLGDYSRIGGMFRFNKGFTFPSQEGDLIKHIMDFKKKFGDVTKLVSSSTR